MPERMPRSEEVGTRERSLPELRSKLEMVLRPERVAKMMENLGAAFKDAGEIQSAVELITDLAVEFQELRPYIVLKIDQLDALEQEAQQNEEQPTLFGTVDMSDRTDKKSLRGVILPAERSTLKDSDARRYLEWFVAPLISEEKSGLKVLLSKHDDLSAEDLIWLQKAAAAYQELERLRGQIGYSPHATETFNLQQAIEMALASIKLGQDDRMVRDVGPIKQAQHDKANPFASTLDRIMEELTKR